MRLFSRLRLLIRSNASALLDRAEHPPTVLEFGHQELQVQLVQVKRGLVEVAAARTRLEQQARKARGRIPRCEEQARRAVEIGSDELASEALRRKHAALAELERIDVQAAEIGDEEKRLVDAQRRLEARVDEFRVHKTILSARYSSARARVKAVEALTGIAGEMTELGLALGRAEEKTERLHARAEALDSLVEAEILLPWGSNEAFGTELDQLFAADAVERELEGLRLELGRGVETPSLASGS